MIEKPDLLAERFSALANQLDDSDWREVRQRARTVRRQLLVIPIAATIAVVAVGSAFALYRGFVDFLSAEPAPERVQLDFELLRKHTADTSARFGGPAFTPQGPAREVMRAEIDGEARALWVVPTREGGFCYRLGSAMSCVTPDIQGREPVDFGGQATADGAGLAWLFGYVSDDAVQKVELLYQDGARVPVPFVWVSTPINGGFYAYDVPRQHEQPGRLPMAVIGSDDDGSAVALKCLPALRGDVARSVPEAVDACKGPR